MSTGTVLVTGGNRGIGRAAVEALLHDGLTVAFTYRSDEVSARGLEAASEGRAHAFALDLSEPEASRRLVTEIEKSMGPLDGLVNNAGIRRESLLAMTSDRDWDEVQTINVGGVFRCCRAVLPGMMHDAEAPS